MEIQAALVKELRSKTGVGIMECKAALKEAAGDIEKAFEVLRKQGLASAAKKIGRTAKEGHIGCYIHSDNKLGVLMELNCETDFVAKTEDFQNLLKDLCMQVAAVSPAWVNRDEIPAQVLEKEREIYTEQVRAMNKPEKIIPKIVEGKLEKYYQETCLMDQPFIKEDKITVAQRVQETIAKLGENIVVRRFIKYRLGEDV